MQNGMHHLNSNIDFGASRNNPTTQFHHVTYAISLLDALTNTIVQSFTAPLAPTRTLIDVGQDFKHATDMLVWARNRNNTMAMEFYEAIRQQYFAEQARVVTGNDQQNAG